MGRGWLKTTQLLTWAVLCLFCASMATHAQAQSTAPAQPALALYHCPSDARIDDASTLSRCTLSERPRDQNRQLGNDQQLLRLAINHPGNETLTTQLFVGPYYLARVDLYQRTDPERLQKISRGGAFQGGNAPSASLGGHLFPVQLAPGGNDFFLYLEAPGFAHLSIHLHSIDALISGAQTRATGVGVHLGMLITLAALALVGVALRPGPVSTRLALLNAVIVLQVGLGSGFIPITMPILSGPMAMTVFMLLIAVRIGLWGWLYQALIAPHHAGRWYPLACWVSYGLAGMTGLLYIMDALVAARALSFVLIIGIPIIHTVAALQAKTLSALLKNALVGSLIAYNLLQIIALVILILYTGQTDLPIFISRALDLIVPLLAMGTVLLRNRATDQQLAATEQDLARKEAQLAAETEAREDKRTLIDMLTHEIRNPLASVRLASKGVEQQISGNDFAKQRLNTINSAVKTIESVIARCELHNRMEGEGITLNPQPVNIPLLLEELAEQHNLSQRLTVTNQLSQNWSIDGQLLEILLSNLLDNARKYSIPESPITIQLQQPNNAALTIRVCNQVSPEMAPDPARLFKRYYRSTHARKMGGSGLGLSLAKRIAELLDGELVYDRTGDTVCFELQVNSPSC